MRALILAPFAEASLSELKNAGIEPVHESWLESGDLHDPEELGHRLERESFDAVIVEADFLFSETFDAAPGLRLAGICRSALNQIDVDAATERGVVVVNTPGRNAAAVSELTIALMLTACRRIVEADRYVRERRWESPTAPYRDLRGTELGGKIAGVIGLGAIGRRVAGLCNAFGMNVLGYDPFVSPAQSSGYKVTWTDLDFLLESSDFVTLHAPPAEDGSALIDERRVGLMKHGAVLVNTASAELVDEEAMINALSTGHLAAAGIDIFSSHPVDPASPLLALPNMVLTPHIGGATEDTIIRHSAAVAGDLIRFSRGERPINIVNDEVWERRRGIT
ncbi:MAG: NAD(P)-dependent oxidoreductase [Chloroflexi bacterium]|nr:NAD(P)-dependent oxidoreductase [Chloroflexota bacterium]MDA1296540.1 NAD(P)-dependent oxidoreductase [Chloroflexota bacterium]